MSEKKTTFEFQTETRRMLELMIHSVYSHKEIFLRELISNSSDALDKLRFESLTNKDFEEYAKNPEIMIIPDIDNNTLTVTDTGIGMNREEIIKYIGTIAKSGSQELLELLQNSEEKDKISPELIGQFGVGFYSSFMVADEVELITRKAGEDTTWKWQSAGDGHFSIEEVEKDTDEYKTEPGTSVVLHLKALSDDDQTDPDSTEKDYTQEWTIRNIVKKYSDFVEYPIKMDIERMEQPKDEEGNPIEDAEPEKNVKTETLNSQKAIWTRPEEDVTEEEYNEFYRHVAHEWKPPLKHILFRGEGTTSFTALLFLPSERPWGLWSNEVDHGLSLYIRNVFIMNDYKDLIPQYLRFIRGVVDSEDLALNISREMLQKDRTIEQIKRAITRKIFRVFTNMLDDEREGYETFWKDFGILVKEGLYTEMKSQKDILDISLFQSTNDETKLTTLKEYIERMPEDQKSIYYITGKSRKIIETSPHLEAFRKKGYEVLILDDNVDELWVTYVQEYKEKPLESVGKGEVEFNEDTDTETKKEEFDSLIEFLKTRLEENIKDVRISGRLVSSPACLVGEKNDMTPQMEQMLKAAGQEMPKVKRILEINPDHDIIKKMQELFLANPTDSTLTDFAEVLYGQAILAEGAQLEEPGKFAEKLSKIMIKAL